MFMFGDNTHVLPEVRPEVTNMPEQTYVAMTDGSARSRELPFSNSSFQVRGVPKHTHNATAISSISGNFSNRLVAEVDLAPGWCADEEKHAVDDFTDSVFFAPAAEVSIYERAIEKGVGRIRLIPENCHQQIDEPTRAIAEIRSIVASKQQLESMTYVEEEGGCVEPGTGVR